MAGPAVTDVAALLEQVGREPSRRALAFYRGKAIVERLLYGELVARVESLASGVHARLGVRAGDRVAVLAPNRPEVPLLVLALMRLGAVVVPLNPTSAPEDWTYILGHSRAKGLFAAKDLAARVPEGARPSFVVHVEDAPGLADQASAAPPPPDDLPERPAVVLYTSGTTGNPKGVTLRQRNVLSNAWSMARNFGLDGTTQLAVLPLYHAHAFGFGLMSALSTGGYLVFTERLEPFTWAEVIRAESVEVTSVVPTLLPMLLAAGVTHEKVPSLRHILVSSAPLAVDVARTFESRTGIPLVQGWGLSEYTNFACCMSPRVRVEDHERLLFGFEVPSIGPALDGTEVRVVDAAGAPAAEGERGELVVRGHSTMLGYLDDPVSTSTAIDDAGWLHTGDEGFFRTDQGRPIFFVNGRIKEIIIRDAEKYSPLRLERRIVEAIPALSGKIVVLGFPHVEHGEEVGAYVELDELDEALRSALVAALATMPPPERPKVILHGTLPIPRTHTGKVQRRKLLPWFAGWSKHRGAPVVERLSERQDVSTIR